MSEGTPSSQVPAPPPEDDVLRALILVVNRFPTVQLAITLNVRGVVVTGTLIGWQEYYKSSASLIRSKFQKPGDASETVAAIFDFMAQWQTKNEEETPKLVTEPHFVHLRDARFLLQEHLVPANGTLWRGRISEVDGFSLGYIDFTPFGFQPV